MHTIHSFDNIFKNNKIHLKLQINDLQTEFINAERIVREKISSSKDHM